MPKPIAYKTGTIQPPNTAKQNNVLVGVGPSNWGAGVANANFYNSLDSSYQYVIVKNSAVPAMWSTGDFTTGSLLTIINGLPERVGQTRFTDANTAISWSLASGEYTILKNEQIYGEPIINGLVLDFNPKVNNYFANGDFAYGTTIGWVGYGGSPFIYDITNDKPYVGSKSTKALANTGGGFTWGRYTSPIYGPAGLLVVGQTYTFSFWAKLISGPSFDLGWNNQNGSGDTSNWSSDQNYTLTNTWQKITRTFTYNISKNFLYFAGTYAGNSQYAITELQLENENTAGPFSSFPVTAAGLTIPNNGLLNTSSFSLTNGPYLNAVNNGNINLDGVDDYIILTDASLKNYTTITANIWMYVNSTGSWETYFSYNAEEAGLSQGWGVRRQASNNMYQYWGGSGNSGIKLYQNGQLLESSNSTYSQVNATINNTWQMVTLVAKGVSSWNTNNRLTIGTRSDSINTATNMNIGSFNLYNRELSAAEIENLYTAGLPTYQASSSIMVNQGLTLYLDATNPNCYPGSGTAIYDLSGYGNNGTLYNGVAYSSTYGGGLVFDGVDDYIVIPGNGTINASRPTVELVMTTSTNGGNIIAQGQYGSNWGFGVGVKSTNIMARNNNCDTTINVNNSGLVHVVVVWDGSGNQYYKNGQYLGRTTNCYSPNPGGDVTIGGVRSQVPSQNLQEFANSTVNIVRIYNRALSGAEILQNFNSIKTQFGL